MHSVFIIFAASDDSSLAVNPAHVASVEEVPGDGLIKLVMSNGAAHQVHGHFTQVVARLRGHEQ